MGTRWNFRSRLLQFTKVLEYRGNVNRFWLRSYNLSRDSADMILQMLHIFRQLFVASLNLKYENFDINGAGISMTSFKNVEDSKVWTSRTRDSTRSKFCSYVVSKLLSLVPRLWVTWCKASRFSKFKILELRDIEWSFFLNYRNKKLIQTFTASSS